MSKSLSLETILSEFTEEDVAWIVGDDNSKQYLTIPDNRFPNREIFRFFLSREDAEKLLNEILDESEKLRSKNIVPIKVKLLQALRGIASEPENGFVIHTPNEVYEFMKDR